MRNPRGNIPPRTPIEFEDPTLERVGPSGVLASQRFDLHIPGQPYPVRVRRNRGRWYYRNVQGRWKRVGKRKLGRLVSKSDLESMYRESL